MKAPTTPAKHPDFLELLGSGGDTSTSTCQGPAKDGLARFDEKIEDGSGTSQPDLLGDGRDSLQHGQLFHVPSTPGRGSNVEASPNGQPVTPQRNKVRFPQLLVDFQLDDDSRSGNDCLPRPNINSSTSDDDGQVGCSSSAAPFGANPDQLFVNAADHNLGRPSQPSVRWNFADDDDAGTSSADTFLPSTLLKPERLRGNEVEKCMPGLSDKDLSFLPSTLLKTQVTG